MYCASDEQDEVSSMARVRGGKRGFRPFKSQVHPCRIRRDLEKVSPHLLITVERAEKSQLPTEEPQNNTSNADK